MSSLPSLDENSSDAIIRPSDTDPHNKPSLSLPREGRGGAVGGRVISLLVLHCSDTRPDQDFTVEKLAACHRARGFGDYPGYHVYIRRDGTCYYTRPLWMKGCHVKNFNAQSIGICYEGGREDSPPAPPLREGSGNHRVVPPHEVGALHVPFGRGGKYCDNRTPIQVEILQEVFATLKELFPDAKILGHNELNPHKACPCLSPPASKQYANLNGSSK